MTQIPDMSKQQLNRTLAELMGYWVDSKKIGDGSVFYRLISPSGKPETTWRGTEEIAWLYAPYYCTDPAASLEVQAAAYAASPEWYLHNLAIVTNQEGLTLDEFPDPFEVFGPELVGPMITATPRERAMAAWMTLKEAEH